MNNRSSNRELHDVHENVVFGGIVGALVAVCTILPLRGVPTRTGLAVVARIDQTPLPSSPLSRIQPTNPPTPYLTIPHCSRNQRVRRRDASVYGGSVRTCSTLRTLFSVHPQVKALPSIPSKHTGTDVKCEEKKLLFRMRKRGRTRIYPSLRQCFS